MAKPIDNQNQEIHPGNDKQIISNYALGSLEHRGIIRNPIPHSPESIEEQPVNMNAKENNKSGDK